MQGVLDVLVPIISVAGFFAWLLARSPVGRAYADRMRAGGGASSADRAEQAQLAEAVDALRREVSELSERMDFAERLLAKGGERDPARLAPRGPGA